MGYCKRPMMKTGMSPAAAAGLRETRMRSAVHPEIGIKEMRE